MKKNIHPKDYKYVVFQDVSCNFSFLTRSTIQTKETIKWEDGKEYPLYKVDISNKSHPYFTGQQNLVDTAGRIEKYMKKYNIKDNKKEKDS
jgi:large subunit ribosomal protein L31